MANKRRASDGWRLGYGKSYFPDHFIHDDSVPSEYVEPEPAPRAGCVLRRTWNRAPSYSGICSTAFKFIHVSLPHISLINGMRAQRGNAYA